MRTELGPGDIALLVDGLNDDVAFAWVLIHLGIRGNPPTDPGPPSTSEVDAAFAALDRLRLAGLVNVGQSVYVDKGPPGRIAPVEHVQAPIASVKARVVEACRSGSDWEWSCWVVNTPAGDEVARHALPPG